MTLPQLFMGQRGCEGINTQCYDDGIYKPQSYVKILFSEAFACRPLSFWLNGVFGKLYGAACT